MLQTYQLLQQQADSELLRISRELQLCIPKSVRCIATKLGWIEGPSDWKLPALIRSVIESMATDRMMVQNVSGNPDSYGVSNFDEFKLLMQDLCVAWSHVIHLEVHDLTDPHDDFRYGVELHFTIVVQQKTALGLAA